MNIDFLQVNLSSPPRNFGHLRRYLGEMAEGEYNPLWDPPFSPLCYPTYMKGAVGPQNPSCLIPGSDNMLLMETDMCYCPGWFNYKGED